MGRDMTDEPKKEESPDAITAKIVDDFQHRMQTLALLAQAQLDHAKDNQAKAVAELRKQEADGATTFVDGQVNAKEKAEAFLRFAVAHRALKDLHEASHEELLAEVLFVSIFSSFDDYLKSLLRNLYSRSTILLQPLGDREVRFSEILNGDKADIIASIAERDIDSLIRSSYPELFDTLASRVERTTLKEFAGWKQFVECSQRRNLIVHCGGVVTPQYLKVCENEKVSLDNAVTVGTRLHVSKAYLLRAIDTAAEAGILIGQSLWRRACPTSTPAADEHLAQTMFLLLEREKWNLVIRLGEFGQTLVKFKNRPGGIWSERAFRVIVLNHAQAAKWLGEQKLAMNIIDAADWTASSIEFNLAVEVLKGNWDNASRLMRKIGNDDPYLSIHAYVGWPIFREFRSTPQFSETFQSVFGIALEEQVRKAENKSRQAAEESGTAKAQGADNASEPPATT
jgi:hypothetical protein